VNTRMMALAPLALLFAFAGASSVSAETPPLRTVETLDIQKYLGRWYEIARFQHGFEKSIVGAAAEYSLRPDGRIQVVNSGFKKDLDGRYTDAKAVAWQPDPAVPGALKVKFFGLFTSDYPIFGLDDVNYTWALVGNNEREFIWFLSRTPTVSAELLEKMKAIAVSQGYDLSGLYLVPQKAR